MESILELVSRDDFRSLIPLGFVVNGALNILGVLLFTRFGTSTSIHKEFPEVFSSRCIEIIMFGLVYIAICNAYQHVPLLVAVLFLEKVYYTLTWVYYYFVRTRTPAGKLAKKDPLAALFFQVYGMNDLLGAIFFGLVCLSLCHVNGVDFAAEAQLAARDALRVEL